MKKKMLALCLSLVLCVSLVPAALAAPESFADVPAGSWFEEGVMTCAEKGVMVGTAEGKFSPDWELTAAECLTLAVRLYDLRHGGDGALQKAPEDWGRITLTLADGTVMEEYSGSGDIFSFWSWPKNDNWGILAELPGETNEERSAWGDAHTGAATLTVDGTDYAGSVHNFIPYGEYVFQFQLDWDESVDLLAVRADLSRAVNSVIPGPDQWWRDTVYTAHRLGLNDKTAFPGFAALLERDLSGGSGAYRQEFSLALAEAAGELPKLYTVETLPDLERTWNEGVWNLYESGVLTGMDEYGRFGASSFLTRAQAAVMVARVLDESQRVQTPPKAGGAYAAAMSNLRNGFGYYNEQLFEADDCTVVVNDYGGMMHAHTGVMRLVYKHGSIPGEGTVIDLPYPRRELLMVCTPADAMELSEDGKTFTYTYFLGNELTYEGEVVRAPGVYVYTVDLPTGEVTETVSPLNYAGAMAYVSRKRIHAVNEHSRDREVVQTLEAPDCTVVLTNGGFVGYDDYILSLVYKPGSALGDGTIKQLILPSTIYDKVHAWYKPTDRAPDTLEVSEDGKTLTYVYHFDAPFSHGSTVYHDAGTYTYTVDLTTGELSVTHAEE